MRRPIEKALLSIFALVFRTLPERGALALGRGLGRMIYSLSSARRRIAFRNVDQAFGDDLDPARKKRIVVGSYEHLGMNIAEFFRLTALTPGQLLDRVTFEGEEILQDALAPGRGVLFLSAHLGNWDYLSAALAVKGYPLALITKISRSEALNELWMGYREQAGITIFMGRGTMKDSIRQLRDGGIVGFVLDQNARRTEGVFVPFFGKDACTLTSLAILARRTGAPVVPVYTFRENGRHRAVIGKPIVTQARDDQESDIVERTAAYTRWTERVIREHPDQWTWLHDRWRTRPGKD